MVEVKQSSTSDGAMMARGIVPLGRAVYLVQVRLLGLGGDSGGRPASLYLDYDDRRFDHPRQPDGLGHEGKTASRSAAHRAHSRITRPHGHIHHGQLVLALFDEHAGFFRMIHHPVQDG